MSTQPPSRTKFYRDKRNGKFMGVCSGIADYTGLDVTLVRIMFLGAMFMSGGSVLPLYFIAGFVAGGRAAPVRRQPKRPFTDERDRRSRVARRA